MERPSTRRGSAADFFEGRGDAPKSATEIVDSTHASARPFSRMVRSVKSLILSLYGKWKHFVQGTGLFAG